jgi:GNAT superfamily N-acetyltransferase
MARRLQPAVHIRTAAIEDVPQVRRVLTETWHATYDGIYGAEHVREITGSWHSEANLLRHIGQPRTVNLVAEADGALVATASAGVGDDGTVMVRRLYVLPAHQGRGIGQALLEHVLACFPAATRAVLEVEPENSRALDFYTANGFQPQVRAGADDPSGCATLGVTATIMERALASFGRRTGAPLILREARDDDAQDLFGLISLCFAEYPGCVVDPHEDLPDLLAPARSFATRRSWAPNCFWVVEDGRGRVGASVAVDFPDEGTAELHRLYVRADLRGLRLGTTLTRMAEEHARRQAATRMVLWSDTRFTHAHVMYRAHGYRQTGERSLQDVSKTVEFGFERAL